MKRPKRPTVDHSEGYVQHGRIIRYAEIDAGTVWLGSTAHRDGKHSPVLGNRCGLCVREYRTVILGHDVPEPAPFRSNRQTES